MKLRGWLAEAVARGLLAPGVAGRYRLLTVWAICTAGATLLLAAVGYAAIGQVTESAGGQLLRLRDDASRGPTFTVERVEARLLQPLLLMQAARVEAELRRLAQGQPPEALLEEEELPLRLAVADSGARSAWRAEFTAGDSYGRGFALTGREPGAGAQFYPLARISARWLRIETLPAARCFIVFDDDMVLALGTAANPAANVPGPLRGGELLPRSTEELSELTKRMAAGEAGTRVVTDPADGTVWVVAYTPLHELGGSYGLLVRRNDLAPELDAYNAMLATSAANAEETVRHLQRRLRVVLLALLAAAWFLAAAGCGVILRMLELRGR